MLKKVLSLLLVLSMLASCMVLPAFSATSVTDLFTDNFEGYGDIGAAVKSSAVGGWNSATNSVIAADPLNSSNKVCEIFASGTQYWPSLHKTVAMGVDETTTFTGKVMLHSSADVAPAYYLEYRNSADGSSANRRQVFHITPTSIRGMDSSKNYGSAGADAWVNYKVEIIPGGAGKETEITVTVTGNTLKNANGEAVPEITFTEKQVLDNIAVHTNNAANMVHNTNINEPNSTKLAKVYIDDIYIYAPPTLSRDATLSSLTYGDSVAVPKFDANIVSYSVALDVGTESVSLNAVANDPDATVSYSKDTLTEFPGSISVTVTAPYGNTKTYTVNFRIKSSENEVASEILKVKNGADAIVTLTFDDGEITTAEYNAEMFEKYDLYGTHFLIGRVLTSSVVPRMQAVVNKGRIDVASHGMYHDGGVYNENSTEQYYKEEIIDSKTYYEQCFPNLDIIVFGPGDGKYTARAKEIIQENYYGMRNGRRGFGSLDPDEDELWSAYVKGIHDESTLEARNAWIDTAIEGNHWLIELWHSIDAPGYMPQTKEFAEAHYSYISQKQKEGKVWSASYTQALKYIRERQISESVATLVGDSVEVDLYFTDNSLPKDIFDYPLTVKVEVPDGWGSAQVSQNGEVALVSTYTLDGKTWANANIIPNGGIAVLTEGVTGGKLESISVNGAAISGFNPDTLSYTLPILTADLPATIVAQPLDSSATVTYSPSATLTETPGTVTITVVDSDNVEKQYTVNFTKELSSNALLSSLTINGTTPAVFDPNITDYIIKTDLPAGGVVINPTPADSTSTVSISDTNVTTLPRDVKITVTAENGAAKIYTLKLSDRNEDTVFAYDNFEAYTVGSNLTAEIWSMNNGATSGTKGGYDPLDPTNKVGVIHNTSGSGQNQQLNRYLGGANTEPIIVKGRYLNPNIASATFTEIIVRGNGTDGINAVKFNANGNIMMGSSSTAGAKFAENEWLNYILVIKPDTNKYSVTGYFYGDGARTLDGEKADVVVATGYTANNSKTDMSKLDARILHKGSVASGEANTVYADDLKIYSAGRFIISMDETDNITTVEGITVKANHDIDMRTVNKDSIVITDTYGEEADIESVTVTDETITVTTAGVLADGSYSLALKDSVKDVVGQSAANTIDFTVGNPNYDAIENLAINTPDNLEQAYDGMAAVNFEVAVTPSENIDLSSIRWYVNGEMQSKRGNTFTFTPTECGKSYEVYAKVNATGITSETRTIVVEEHPIVPITALALDTPANIAQTVGNVSPVTFTALTTPGEYVDVSTIEWYLDGVKQDTTGKTFTFTPADETVSYVVYAQVTGTDVKSDAKTVSVTLRIPKADVLHLDEPISPTEYKDGGNIISNTDSVASHRYSAVAGKVSTDPFDSTNLTARFNKGDYLQFRSTLPAADDVSYYVSGDLLIPDHATSTFDIMVRNSKAPVLITFNNTSRADGRVTFAGKQISNVFTNENEWVHYTIKFTFNNADLTKSTAQLFLSGGLKNTDYYESEEVTIDLTGATGSGKYMLYRSSPSDENSLPHLDNMKTYTTTDFLLSMEKTSGVAPSDTITVDFNHDAKLSTLTKNNITLQSASGKTIAVESVSYDLMDPSAVTIKLTENLEGNETYTVMFAEALKDVAGNSATNTVSFTTEKSGNDVVYGDVNGDGTINALDRAALTRYLAKWTGYDTLANEAGADVNGDGTINALDRAGFTRYLAKWTGYDALPLK